MQVLSNDPAAPIDMREKAIRIAGHILENDPALRGGAGYARAQELLESGAALTTMQRMIDAKGAAPAHATLGHLTMDVVAEAAGVFTAARQQHGYRLAEQT